MLWSSNDNRSDGNPSLRNADSSLPLGSVEVGLRKAELWLLAWQSAVSHGMEQFIEAIPGAAALPDWRRPEAIDLSALPVLGRVRTDLSTMLLLEQREQTQSQETPVLIVAPYAVHDASIGDFADRHSVAQILSKEHPVAMTFWKSATAQMRYYGIDALSERSERRDR